MVSVNCALPVAIEAGLRLVMMGDGGSMVKVAGADVPPAEVTVTLALPAVATRLAGTAAERMAPWMTVVTSGVPFQLTFAGELKLEPTTVSEKAPWPA